MANRADVSLVRIVASAAWPKTCEMLRKDARNGCTYGGTPDEMLHGAYKVAAVEDLITIVERAARREDDATPPAKMGII